MSEHKDDDVLGDKVFLKKRFDTGSSRDKGLQTGGVIMPRAVGNTVVIDEETFNIEETRQDLLDRGEFEVHAEFLEADRKERLIQGYANTKNLDRMGEIILPSAFKSSLKQWLKTGQILLHHIPYWSIGSPVDARIDDKGLWIKARLGENITLPGGVSIDDVWGAIEQKLLRAFSVGFRIVTVDREDDIPVIKDLELYETSVVSIGANRQSLFSVAKGVLYGSDYGRDFYEQYRSGKLLDNLADPENWVPADWSVGLKKYITSLPGFTFEKLIPEDYTETRKAISELKGDIAFQRTLLELAQIRRDLKSTKEQ